MITNKIIKLNRLTADLAFKISELNKRCNVYDNSNYELFTDFEMNIVKTHCIYLTLNNDNVIGILSVFTPSGNECWIYSLVEPSHRHKGVFSNMYNSFLSDNADADIIFPISYRNDDVVSILNHYGYTSQNTEYIMKYTLHKDSSNILSVIKNDMELEYEENEVGNEFSLWQKDEYIGGCLIDTDSSTATIYEFGIKDEYQGKGYGKAGLNLILNELTNMNFSSVILQVNGENTKALNLYKAQGFTIISTEYFFTRH